MPTDNPPPRHAEFPAYSYVPGLWPHPHSHPDGHRFGPPFPAANLNDAANDPTFQLGIDLFNAGYYWESHEAWEFLWHAAGRKGPLADFFKGLIQLAVAGVKVREGRRDGAELHARRAAELFSGLGEQSVAGFEPRTLAELARSVADGPPPLPVEPRKPVEVVVSRRLERTSDGPPR